MTDPQLLADYERRFLADPDPWGYETSDYERRKREATVQACGLGTGRRALELGTANGVLAAALAPLVGTLVAVDAVPAAAALARARLAEHPGAQVVTGQIPDDVPGGPFELVVASEILYYLEPAAYEAALAALPDWLAAGGRLVAVHWRPTSDERPRSADAVHADLQALDLLAHERSAPTDDYLLDAWLRRA